MEVNSPTSSFDCLPVAPVPAFGSALAWERLLHGFFILPGRILKPPTSPFFSVRFLCFSCRHGRRAGFRDCHQLLCLRASLCLETIATSLPGPGCTSATPLQPHFAIEAPYRRATPPPSRGLAWPGRHGPLPAELRPPSGSPGHTVARPPLQLPPVSLHWPEIELLRHPLFFKSRSGTSSSNSGIGRGFSVNRRLI